MSLTKATVLDNLIFFPPLHLDNPPSYHSYTTLKESATSTESPNSNLQSTRAPPQRGTRAENKQFKPRAPPVQEPDT